MRNTHYWMHLDTLRLFAEVAARSSFTAVATRHDLSPSSVSRAIGQLERQLGARLFQRSTRKLALTEAGARLQARVGSLLDAFDSAVEEVRAPTSAPRGTLRMTVSVAFGERVIAPLVGEFRSRCPEVALDLRFSDRRIDLVADGIDLAVRLGDVVGADLVATRLMTTSYRVVASPAWLAARGRRDTHRPSHPNELGAQRCVLIDLAGYRNAWRWRPRAVATGATNAETARADRSLAIEGSTNRTGSVRVDGDIRCSSVLGVRRCAIDGLGPALLADWLIDDDLATGRLVDLYPQHELSAGDFDTAAWLVYPSRAWLPGKTRAMIDFLKERLGPA